MLTCRRSGRQQQQLGHQGGACNTYRRQWQLQLLVPTSRLHGTGCWNATAPHNPGSYVAYKGGMCRGPVGRRSTQHVGIEACTQHAKVTHRHRTINPRECTLCPRLQAHLLVGEQLIYQPQDHRLVHSLGELQAQGCVRVAGKTATGRGRQTGGKQGAQGQSGESGVPQQRRWQQRCS